MGGVEVPISRIDIDQGGNALAHGKRGVDWYELRRAGRGCGELRVRVRVRARVRVRVRARVRVS